MKTLFAVLAGLVAVLGLTWIAQGNDFFLTKVFAPKYEQVRRETFEQSKSYNDGMAQELQNMQFEYIKADKQAKAALKPIILHRSAGYDLSKLPADTRQFIENLRTDVQ